MLQRMYRSYSRTIFNIIGDDTYTLDEFYIIVKSMKNNKLLVCMKTNSQFVYETCDLDDEVKLLSLSHFPVMVILGS